MVAEELANHIDPDAPGAGKTLIFAATDAHADIVVSAVKKAFAAKYGEIDDAAVKKITGSVDNVRTLIRSLRNDASPKIAVTVDLLHHRRLIFAACEIATLDVFPPFEATHHRRRHIRLEQRGLLWRPQPGRMAVAAMLGSD